MAFVNNLLWNLKVLKIEVFWFHFACEDTFEYYFLSTLKNYVGFGLEHKIAWL